MIRYRKYLIGLALLACITGLFAQESQSIGSAIVTTTDKSFKDARESLVFAIEGRGLVISYVSHASDMLSRTAEAVGVSDPVYDQAEILLFCKADLSHTLVAENPHDLVLCPYGIAVYTLAGNPDQAFYSYRNPVGTSDAYQPVVELLNSIIEEALWF